MSNVVVKIDGVSLPYTGANDLPVGITYAIDDPDAPGTVSGTRGERNIVIPATKEAQGIYGEFVQGGRWKPSARHRKPARIEVDGLPVFRGTAQLAEVNGGAGVSGRAPVGYKAALIGNNGAWFAAFQAMKLSDVVHTYVEGEDFTEVWAAAHVDADPDADKYGLILAKLRDFETATEVKYSEHTLFVFVRAVLRDAFAAAGYTFQSDYFDSEEGKRWIHALPARPISEDFTAGLVLYMEDENNTTPLSTLGGAPTLIKIQGTASANNAGLFYDPLTGFYTVQFSGHYTLTYGGSGDENNAYFVLDDALNNVGLISWPLGEVKQSVTVFLTQGQLIGLYGGGPIGATAKRSLFAITPAFEFGENYTIDLGLLCGPDWTLDQFYLGLVAVFNLQTTTDNDAGVVRCEPSDAYRTAGTRVQGFYLENDREDITGRVDLGRVAAYKADYKMKQYYGLEWATDSGDENAEALEQTAKIKTYGARYDFGVEFAEGEDGRTVPYFVKTVHYKADNLRHPDSGVTPQLPIFQKALLSSAVTKAVETEPRLLYYAGRRGGADGYVRVAGSVTPYDYPAAFMVNYNDDGTQADPSLSFAMETTDLGHTVDGLLIRFHFQELARRQRGTLAEEWVFWRAHHIMNLSFRRKYLINGAAWLLKRIETWVPGASGATKTILQRDEAPTVDDTLNIVNTALRGIITNE